MNNKQFFVGIIAWSAIAVGGMLAVIGIAGSVAPGNVGAANIAFAIIGAILFGSGMIATAILVRP